MKPTPPPASSSRSILSRSRRPRLSPALPSQILLVLATVASSLEAAPRADRGREPARTHVTDLERRIDVNRLNMWVTNLGSFAFDLWMGDAGLHYPKGQGTSVLFAGGLWLGATDPVRVTVSEYSQEYAPGTYDGIGYEFPSLPDLRVYKMKRWTGDPADSTRRERTAEELAADPTLDPIVHHSWAEYRAGAIPRGAPARVHRLPVTDTPAPDDSVSILGPDVAGDQMLWSVFHDADPSRHTNSAGNSDPLGVEVRHTTFGFDRPGPLGDAVFLRWEVTYRGTGVLGVHPAVWTDPDIGGAPGFTDDLVGSDPGRDMGYAYNGDGEDGQFGVAVPAVGIRLLGTRMFAFGAYRNGTDPNSPSESFHTMSGRTTAGDPLVDPVTGLATSHMFPGDPLTGSGWLDSQPADRRMIVAATPRTLAGGQTFVLEAAIVVGHDSDARRSIEALRCNADWVLQSYLLDHEVLDPPNSAECPTVRRCARQAAEWRDLCDGALPRVTLGGIAQAADARSAYFAWGGSPDSLCAAIGGSDPAPRAEADRQFATLLANATAARLGVSDAEGVPIQQSPTLPVSCPGVQGNTVEALLRTGSREPSLSAVTYHDVGPNPRALNGLGFGLPFFQGGAGYARDLFPSTLDPATSPDSFATVEMRFGVSQKAYRFLRRRLTGGGFPPGGAGYLYGGYHEVPFQLWDMDRNVQLEAAFVENVFTDEAGTILPPAAQPASFDSTWMPIEESLEYVFLLRPAYSGVPDPALAIDGFALDHATPVLYVLLAQLRDPSSVIDPGDRIEFRWSRPALASVDQRMIELGLTPADDPAALEEYRAIAACLEAVNAACDGTTPALATLVHATARTDVVELEWYVPGWSGARVQRANAGGAWSDRGETAKDGRDRIVHVDRDVVAGRTYGYRLRDDRGRTSLETWIEVPMAHRLAIHGTLPSPAVDGALLVLSLPQRAPARLDLLDVAGRRVLGRDLRAPEPGVHALRITELDRLPAGVYWARLVQGGESARARIVRLP